MGFWKDMSGFAKGTIIVLGSGAIVFAGIVVWKVALAPLFLVNTAVDAGKGVVSKTINPDNILSNYEMFKDLYNGGKQQIVNIQSTEKSIQTLKDTYGKDASLYPKDVRAQLAHLNETLDGLKMQYSRTVSDYNSNSSKLNRNLFKDKQLPYELPLDYNQWQN